MKKDIKAVEIAKLIFYRLPLTLFIYAPVRLGVHLFAFLHELFEDLLTIVEKF